MMTHRPSLKRWVLALQATALLGLGLVTPVTSFAQETPAPVTEAPAPAAPAEDEEPTLDPALKAIFDKAGEYVAAVEAAGDDEEKLEAISWEDYVSEDADTVWAMIKDADTSFLDALSPEVNQAIYDNVWTNSSSLTPWLTHNIWVLIAAFLVFIMHLGFATLESGLTQSKNTVNILFKNCWIIATGILLYFLWGFNAHYPGWDNGFFAMGSSAEYGANQLLSMATNVYHDSYTWWTDFIFQAMFAATAATIVSGAVAERIKLMPFMLFAVLLVGLAYPWAGSWHWGGGILANLPSGAFYDFAGSTVVHAFGGFAALACVLILGPRKGKYTAQGIRPILGHSMPLATIGVFLLFLGWFGFNGGSVLAAEPHLVSLVFVTTALAAVSGAIASIVVAWGVLKKPDLSMALNGFLAGLVGITAGADAISPTMSIVVGLVAGVLVVFSIVLLDRIKIDDPVGAISVHGTCGIWGTLAVAFFGGANFMSQIIGVLVVCAFAFVFSFVVFYLIKLTMGVRVSEEEEMKGLDVEEHGSPAYHFGQDTSEIMS